MKIRKHPLTRHTELGQADQSAEERGLPCPSYDPLTNRQSVTQAVPAPGPWRFEGADAITSKERRPSR